MPCVLICTVAQCVLILMIYSVKKANSPNRKLGCEEIDSIKSDVSIVLLENSKLLGWYGCIFQV